MRRILITGASGFIGRALCKSLGSEDQVKGLFYNHQPVDLRSVSLEKIDLFNETMLDSLCREYPPDIVVHCAGIAHQGQGKIDRDAYFRINCEATRKLAVAAFRHNPDVHFIHLSSVSVYGETGLAIPVTESHPCRPNGDYADSKRAAEKSLIELQNQGVVGRISLLRLAPVYDVEWHLNLDRRILLPRKLAFMRVGNGRQQISALARPNLIDFIRFLINRPASSMQPNEILNICDAKAYSFNEIIHVYKKCGLHSQLPVIWMPLSVIFSATRLWGMFNPVRRKWIHAVYEKLAHSFIYDNRKLIQTGFQMNHSLESIFPLIEKKVG